MGVLIIRTDVTNSKATEFEPYKSFLTKFERLEKSNDIWEGIYIDLERCCFGENKPFDIERYYFLNPGINMSYYEFSNEDKGVEKYLINLELEFSFDERFGEIISNGLAEIEKKKRCIYIHPKVEESQLSYCVSRGLAKLEIYIITREKGSLKEISLSLLSLVVTLLAKGW